MSSDSFKGTATRAVGEPPPIDKTGSKANAPQQGDSGDRWRLGNAIDDHLGWLPHPEYRVLRVLFRHADATGKAWPGQSRIAKACGLNRGHVSRLLSLLVGRGMIEVVRRGHKESRKATVYRLRPPSQWPTKMPPDECAWRTSGSPD